MEDFEEMAEEVEEDIDEFQDDAQEAGESILEEVQEQPSASNSRENYSYTSISEVRNTMRKSNNAADTSVRFCSYIFSP